MEILGNIIGFLVFCGVAYFIYTRIEKARNRPKSTGGSSGRGSSGDRQLPK